MNYQFNGTSSPWKLEIEDAEYEGRPINRLSIVSYSLREKMQISSGHGNLSAHFPPKNEAEANFRLLCAAPDLLSACITIVNSIEENQREGFYDEKTLLVSAIKKALNIKI